MRNFLITLIVWLGLFQILCAFQYGQKRSEKLLLNAETFYFLGLAENGSVHYYKKGLSFLDSLEAILKNQKINEVNEIKLKCKTLRQELEKQIELAQLTFSGRYPLVNYLGKLIFIDPEAYQNYELFDEPLVSAVMKGSKDLIKDFLAFELGDIQYDVLFISDEEMNLAESKAKYVLNKEPSFFIMSDKGLYEILSKEEIKSINQSDISKELISKITNAINKPVFVLVSFQKLNNVDDVYWVLAKASVYKNGELNPILHSRVFSLTVDSRKTPLLVILLFTAIFIIPLIWIFLYHWKIKTTEFTSKKLLLYILAFLTGSVIPWILITLHSSIKPQPDNMFWLSFWWAGFFGLGIFIAPVIIYKIALRRIHIIKPIVDHKEGTFLLLFSYLMGVITYSIPPIVLFYHNTSISIFVVVSIILITSAYANIFNQYFVNMISRNGPIILSIIAIFFGFVFLQGNEKHIIVLNVLVFIWGLIYTSFTKKSDHYQNKFEILGGEVSEREEINHDILNIEGIANLADNPPFYSETDMFKTIKSIGDQIFCSNKNILIGLWGKAGVGKTASSTNLIKELKNEARSKNIQFTVLKGDCPEKNNNSVASMYTPFVEAFKSHINITNLIQNEPQTDFFDKAVDGIGEFIIPFSGLFFSHSENSNNLVHSKIALIEAMKKAILKIKGNGILVLLFEDVHWMDESSRELLETIILENSKNLYGQVLVILTSRDKKILDDFNNNIQLVKINSLSREVRLSILKNNFHLSQNVSSKILEQIGSGEITKGDLFWMYHIIKQLALSGAFVQSGNLFEWSEEYKKLEKLPIPNEYRDSIKRIFYENPSYKNLLAFASCQGMVFDLSVLSECLNLNRLTILNTLSEIETETNFVYDPKYEFNKFKFQSSFMLEIIKEELGITFGGIADRNVSQLVREYHAISAINLEKKYDNTNSMLYIIAKNYYAAGYGSIDKALEYCMKCTNVAINIFQFDIARKFISLAEELINYLDKTDEYLLKILLLNCDISHIEGRNGVTWADRCLQYYSSDPAIDNKSLLVFIRTQYNAGAETRNQFYFRKAVDLSQTLLLGSDSNIEKAEAMQFIAISLPPEKLEEKIKYLENSIDLILKIDTKDIVAEKLLSRIYDSLAGTLQRLPTNQFLLNKKRIESLYEESIRIKSKNEINDLPGLARSYGGFGRYFFFQEPNNIPKARECFYKDLEISKKIFDVAGQAQMFSLLGECDLWENDLDSAINNYTNSKNIADGYKDKVFAYIGIMNILIIQQKYDKLNDAGSELLKLVKESKGEFPSDCKNRIQHIFKSVDFSKLNDWYNELKEYLK